MTGHSSDVRWKDLVTPGDGYFTLPPELTGNVPVRMFLTPQLLADVEPEIFPQIVAATRFPGVRLVVITPDVHHGYGVPVGCAILTDAGGNFAIVNRLILAEEVAAAFRDVFGDDLELLYEISHNLVQREWHPDFGEVNVHRKGATRAFPAGHPGLDGTPWAATGHPVLIPGSNRDHSYILRPAAAAVNSAFSVNHGAGVQVLTRGHRRHHQRGPRDRRARAVAARVDQGHLTAWSARERVRLGRAAAPPARRSPRAARRA